MIIPLRKQIVDRSQMMGPQTVPQQAAIGETFEQCRLATPASLPATKNAEGWERGLTF
jgi:hypothetical protein